MNFSFLHKTPENPENPENSENSDVVATRPLLKDMETSTEPPRFNPDLATRAGDAMQNESKPNLSELEDAVAAMALSTEVEQLPVDAAQHGEAVVSTQPELVAPDQANPPMASSPQ